MSTAAKRTHRGPSSSRAPATAAFGACVATIAVAASAGCQKTLFPKDAPRTQFELSDRMRRDYVPLEEFDVFGNPQPNLRGRLIRRD
jgi:hypothetical protein